MNQIKESSAKSLFYDDDTIPSNIVDAAKKLLDYSKVSDIFDHISLIKWISYKLYAGDLSSLGTYHNNRDFVKSFNDIAEIKPDHEVLSKFLQIFNKYRFDSYVKFFKIIAKKKNYTKFHFQHKKYIPEIEDLCLKLINAKNFENFDFPIENAIIEKVDNRFFWNYAIMKDDYFSKDEMYQLRRYYDELEDNEILKDTNLEKIIFTFHVNSGFIALFNEIPFEHEKIVYKFLIDKINKNFYQIDFFDCNPVNKFVVANICDETYLQAPLEFYTFDDYYLKRELVEYLRNSFNIKTIDDEFIFKFDHYEIMKFSTFVDFNFDFSNVSEKQEIFINNLFLTHINSSIKMDISVNEIWESIIDQEKIAKFYDFKFNDQTMNFFRKNFLSDYMIKSACRDAIIDKNFSILQETLIDLFKIKYNSRDNYHYIYIYDYIKDVLINSERRGDSYDFPTNGWKILEMYYNDKVSQRFRKRINNTKFFSNITEATEILIEILQSQYQDYIISDEMRNI